MSSNNIFVRFLQKIKRLFSKKIKIGKFSVSIATIVGITALCSLMVLAFFNVSSSFDNKLQVGKIGSTLIETFDAPTHWDGSPVKKEVSFKNTGDVPLVLRFQYAESWTGVDGVVLPNTAPVPPDTTPLIDVCTKRWTVPNAFNDMYDLPTPPPVKPSDGKDTDDRAYWTDGGDGWFYYNYVFGPNETVRVMKAVQASKAYTEKYYGARYKLSFVYEALQIEPTNVTAMWAKTPTVTTTVVQNLGKLITWH